MPGVAATPAYSSMRLAKKAAKAEPDEVVELDVEF
jgi:hypothetical protein